MTFFQPPPPPPTKLGRYRILSPNAGVRVSPLQLGAMSIGDKWQKHGMGSMDKQSSFKLLDAYYDAGGNFIDTANNCVPSFSCSPNTACSPPPFLLTDQDESSEEFIGEWAEKRGIRDQLVIATKAGILLSLDVRASLILDTSSSQLIINVETTASLS